MKKVLAIAGGGLVLLAAVLVIRAAAVGEPAAPEIRRAALSVGSSPVAQHLAEAIRIRTISHQDRTLVDGEAFEAFIDWAQASYPRVHEELRRERVDDYTLLFTWIGSDPALAPILMTGHYDVVPVTPESVDDWAHPPFAGETADGFVWGRGALDDKSAVVAMLEAVTGLLAQGFRPERTLYLSFGHDEEVGGGGAVAVTELLRSRGVSLAWTIDEGSFLPEAPFPGIERPLAPINVAEKGYLTLEFVARGAGGHSSMPPRHTAVGVLASAIVKIEQSPLPGGLDGFPGDMIDALTPHLPFAARIVLANRWLFDPVIEYYGASNPTSNSMIRTTTAATMISGSIKENVLPTQAVAAVNFRLHPRDSIESVIEHVIRVVDDERIEVRPLAEGTPASPVSSAEAGGYREIANALRAAYGPLIVTPGVTVGGTDSRHYGRIAADAYRINPMLVSRDLIGGFHGTDERIPIAALEKGVEVYAHLMQGDSRAN